MCGLKLHFLLRCDVCNRYIFLYIMIHIWTPESSLHGSDWFCRILVRKQHIQWQNGMIFYEYSTHVSFKSRCLEGFMQGWPPTQHQIQCYHLDGFISCHEICRRMFKMTYEFYLLTRKYDQYHMKPMEKVYCFDIGILFVMFLKLVAIIHSRCFRFTLHNYSSLYVEGWIRSGKYQFIKNV